MVFTMAATPFSFDLVSQWLSQDYQLCYFLARAQSLQSFNMKIVGVLKSIIFKPYHIKTFK